MVKTIDDTDLAQALKVLGHPARVHLLRLLSEPEHFPQNLVDPRAIGICVNDLAKAANLPQSTASHHLSLLAGAGLITTTEHGPWRYIRANQARFASLSKALSDLAP